MVPFPTNTFFFSSLILTITSIFLIIVILKNSTEKIHHIWALFNVAILVWGAAALWVSTIHENYQLATVAWKIACGIGVTFTATFMLHLAYLLTKKNIRIVLIFSYLVSFSVAILILATNFVYEISLIKFDNIFIKAPKIPYLIWFIIWFLVVSYAHFLLFFHIKEENKKNLKELKIFTIATAIAFGLGGLNFLSVFRLPLFEYGNYGLTAYCILATYIIFRHKFLGINVVLQKGLFYSVLIAVLTGLYLILILLIELIFRGLIGYKSLILSLSSAFIIALLFNPIRNRIQVLVDRLFLGKTSDEFAQENKLLKQELERSERLKVASTLALGLAHEIKNPLSTIKTFSEYLPQNYKNDEFVSKFAHLIPKEIERINDIVCQLLQFSKPAPPHLKEVLLYQLLQETLTFLQSEFLRRKIKLNESYQDSQLKIKADPDQIKQAILNILLNAIDAMPEGGTLTIETKNTDNSFIELTIKDTGCGIDENDLTHIFDPFFSKKENGTGLGLSITYQIVKNHTGSIKVASNKNNGSSFTIKIPLI